MRNVGWPNSVSPGISPFRVDVPVEWSAIEPPDALIAFLAPPVDDFRVNLVIDGRRTPADLTLGDIAESVLTRDTTEVEVIGQDGADSPDQLPSAARRATLTVDGRSVSQLVVTTETADQSPTGTRTVYTLVGSCLKERANVDEHILTEMISSFTVIAANFLQ